MDDDRKKPARPGGRERGRERGPAKPGKGGAGKPFRTRDGEGPGRREPGGGPERARPEGKPPFSRKDGEKKPFVRQDGEKRAFAGDRPGRGTPRPGKREREEAAAGGEAGAPERIARRLARAGVASRRDAEEMIAAGRVTLNGKVLSSPAVNVGAGDRIELDGKEIPAVERTRLFLFHKPAGVVTTNKDPQGRRTVFDVLPAGLPRLMTVGRLDINTEGLLLLTNDGGLSRVLELPDTGWLRRYRVRVHGKVDPDRLAALRDGIAVDGVFYGAIEATLDREQGSNAWLTLAFREGKNREAKNVLGALGLDVTRLIRVSYGPFQLGELGEGEVRELKGRTLRDQLGERLIAASGANFEAPVLNEFSSKPVAAKPRVRENEPAERPNRKREREQKRADALDRLQTSRPERPGRPKASGAKEEGKRFGRPGGPQKPPAREAKGSREERPATEQRPRKANVWMAPGAKPMGEKKAAAVAERNEGRRYAGKPRPAPSGRDGKPAPRKPGQGPRKPRGER